MRMEIKKVTPEFASALLESNKSNRRINKTQLDMLVRAMLGGEWRLTHQGVAIYTDGELADGQHRLLAVVKSGVTCEMPVFYGVEKEKNTVMAIDCGKQRSAVDSGRISGSKLTTSTTTIAKGMEFGYASQMDKLTHSELLGLCDKHKESICNISLVFPANRKGIAIAPVKVAIATAINNGVDLDLAREFCDSLVSGEYNSDVMINAIRLRNKLMSANYNGGSDRDTAFRMTLNTINSTAAGVKIKRISSK